MRKVLSVAAMTLFLAACGSPKAGDKCEANKAACSSDVAALFCEGGTYSEIPCKGTNGCSENDGEVTCAIQAASGDACLDRQEGQAQCDAANENNAFQCVSGKWQAVECNGCAVQAGAVVCFN